MQDVLSHVIMSISERLAPAFVDILHFKVRKQYSWVGCDISLCIDWKTLKNLWSWWYIVCNIQYFFKNFLGKHFGCFYKWLTEKISIINNASNKN